MATLFVTVYLLVQIDGGVFLRHSSFPWFGSSFSGYE